MGRVPRRKVTVFATLGLAALAAGFIAVRLAASRSSRQPPGGPTNRQSAGKRPAAAATQKATSPPSLTATRRPERRLLGAALLLVLAGGTLGITLLLLLPSDPGRGGSPTSADSVQRHSSVPSADPVRRHSSVPSADPVRRHSSVPSADPVRRHSSPPSTDPVQRHSSPPSTDPVQRHGSLPSTVPMHRYRSPRGWSMQHPNGMYIEHASAGGASYGIDEVTLASFRSLAGVQRHSFQHVETTRAVPPRTRGGFPARGIAVRVLRLHLVDGVSPRATRLPLRLSSFRADGLFRDWYPGTHPRPMQHLLLSTWHQSYFVQVWMGPKTSARQRALLARMVASISVRKPRTVP